LTGALSPWKSRRPSSRTIGSQPSRIEAVFGQRRVVPRAHRPRVRRRRRRASHRSHGLRRACDDVVAPTVASGSSRAPPASRGAWSRPGMPAPSPSACAPACCVQRLPRQRRREPKRHPSIQARMPERARDGVDDSRSAFHSLSLIGASGLDAPGKQIDPRG